jgi:hypothetical protein
VVLILKVKKMTQTRGCLLLILVSVIGAINTKYIIKPLLIIPLSELPNWLSIVIQILIGILLAVVELAILLLVTHLLIRRNKKRSS